MAQKGMEKSLRNDSPGYEAFIKSLKNGGTLRQVSIWRENPWKAGGERGKLSAHSHGLARAITKGKESNSSNRKEHYRIGGPPDSNWGPGVGTVTPEETERNNQNCGVDSLATLAERCQAGGKTAARGPSI